MGSFRISEWPSALNFTSRRSSVKPVNAEPKRNDSIVPLAATIVAPGALIIRGGFLSMRDIVIKLYLLFFHLLCECRVIYGTA